MAVRVTIEQIKKDLKDGYVRYNTDKYYSEEKKNSLMDKYNVSRAAVSKLFKHEELKGLKTNAGKEDEIELIEPNDPTPENPSQGN